MIRQCMFPVRQCFSFISYHIVLRIPFVYLALCEKVFSERFGGKQTDENPNTKNPIMPVSPETGGDSVLISVLW